MRAAACWCRSPPVTWSGRWPRCGRRGVSSVAVCLLHSYANPEHERRIGDALRSELPALDVSLSCELLPEAREYERTSTTVINGYIRPVVERYLRRLVAGLRRAGTEAPVNVMQSNGGLMPVELAARKPMYCIESGPAAGVIGAAEVGARLGQPDLITFDMGGTTAKASIVEGGQVLLAPECEVGGGMNAGHRLLRGAGYVLRVPTIDIAEVSAGGGSIAWADRAGGLQIGPHSAGALPGPVCYAAGGTEPTVADADVALGYLNPEHLLGGTFPIAAELARVALRERLAEPAGLTLTEAAWGVHTLANVKMGGALRAVSSERGRDPRRFAMLAFGGSGPVHAAGLAASLGIGRVIVPRRPVCSALSGCCSRRSSTTSCRPSTSRWRRSTWSGPTRSWTGWAANAGRCWRARDSPAPASSCTPRSTPGTRARPRS